MFLFACARYGGVSFGEAMSQLFRRFVFSLLATSLLAAFTPIASADTIAMERGQMKGILDQVAKRVEKEYYDPTLHGLKWAALVAEAGQKIDKATDPGDM